MKSFLTFVKENKIVLFVFTDLISPLIESQINDKKCIVILIILNFVLKIFSLTI